MSQGVSVLSEGDIQACNVLPAYEASLAAGATEAEVSDATGWSREGLEAEDAAVSGASTYAHLAWMHGRAGYAEFVQDAARRHTASSLGVVGLACKTAATVGEALARHRRYQHLTNRTADYMTFVEDGALVLEETRPDPDGQAHGSRLMSDFTMLVAAHLLRTVAASPPALREVRSRRDDLPAAERAAYEAFTGCPWRTGHRFAAVVLDPALLEQPTAAADPELAAHFDRVLARAAGDLDEAPGLVGDVRRALRAALTDGPPDIEGIAAGFGLGGRTLQRRLAAEKWTFTELLDDVRRRLADGYLQQPELTSTEIAFLLGYEEPASFFRAFRRWHDTTPGAYRAARS